MSGERKTRGVQECEMGTEPTKPVFQGVHECEREEERKGLREHGCAEVW